jgi:dTDP-L-rhamnose 4-epimerase
LIGSHVVDLLLENNHDVRILDNLHEQTHPRGRPAWIPEDVEFVEGDIRDPNVVARCLRGVDEVYHEAAFGGFTPEMSKYFDTNVMGTALLFETIALKKLDVRKIVVASSQAVYGEGLYRCAIDGDVQPPMRSIELMSQGIWEPVCPICGREIERTLTPETVASSGETAYAISKLAEERIAIGLGKGLGIPTVALRYSVTFGPRQSVFNPYTGVVSMFSTLLVNGLQPTVFEDGRQTRDWIFVRDVAAANLVAMESEQADWCAFNVGRGKPVTVIELIEELARCYELSPDYRCAGEFRPGDVRHLVPDASQMRALGWEPQTSLRAGIEAVADWIRQLGPLEEFFTRALHHLREVGVVMETA